MRESPQQYFTRNVRESEFNLRFAKEYHTPRFVRYFKREVEKYQRCLDECTLINNQTI